MHTTHSLPEVFLNPAPKQMCAGKNNPQKLCLLYSVDSADVAWYYFKAGVTQAVIAEKLGLNRSKVIACPDEARRDGTVPPSVFATIVKTLDRPNWKKPS